MAQARIIAPKRDYVWNTRFTTTSGEYKGLSKKGKPVYVIAHGVGPLTDPGRIRQAYEEGLVRGAAKLTQDELYALLEQEDDKNVIVLDYDKVKKLASDVVSVKSARDNALVRARLGEHTDAYLDKHKEVHGDKTSNWHDCYDLDLRVPYGRLLFVGDDNRYIIVGCDNLDSYGRFVGIAHNQKTGCSRLEVIMDSDAFYKQQVALRSLNRDIFEEDARRRAAQQDFDDKFFNR